MPLTEEKISIQSHSQTELKFALDVSNRAIVSLRGKDGLDLIQRLSTNEVSNLEIGKSDQTILTNEKGKIVDVISMLKLQNDELLLVGNTTGDTLRAWIEKYIIMEDALVEDQTNIFAHYLLYGSGVNLLDDVEMLGQGYNFTERWNTNTLFHAVSPLSAGDEFASTLSAAGYLISDVEHFTAFRIEQGIPAYPNELSLQYNPMEAGLIDQISFTKGCYIGQEVIARLDTYKKVQKKLVKLELGAQPETVPCPVFDDRGEVGTTTSVVPGTQHRPSRALGYIKASVIDDNKPLFFLNKNQQTPVKIID